MRQAIPFGKYLLLDRISVGGMAEVFKAKSYGVEGFEKVIAIKRILPSMGEDRDFIKMFIDEAKIAGQLAHANICQIFELGRIDGSHFIAMEYIWGKDLLQIQNRVRKLRQAMPVAMSCFVVAKVCEGLDYAHRKRDPLGRALDIVHRDCSPQNVLISYEGEVKLIDFGIAKAASRSSRTMAGVLKGKFGYMSPEQVRGLPLDRRSDIFALGTILYECLTGERLFQGETDFSTLEKVRNVDIQPPSKLNPQIPAEIERVILKALARDPDDRYQWCSELHADLQRFLMTQEQVYTAKSLATWLKDAFANEIDRERSQLEEYKRVGKDGLILGQPAAQAKLDIVEHLGEAGKADDPTMLGAPTFDDMVPDAAGPALGSPAATGAPPPQASRESSRDFSEEAPTAIFGELDDAAKQMLEQARAQVAAQQAAVPAVVVGRQTAPVTAMPIPRAQTTPPPTPMNGGNGGIAAAPPAQPSQGKTLLGVPAPVIPQGGPLSPYAQPGSAPFPAVGSQPGYGGYQTAGQGFGNIMAPVANPHGQGMTPGAAAANAAGGPVFTPPGYNAHGVPLPLQPGIPSPPGMPAYRDYPSGPITPLSVGQTVDVTAIRKRPGVGKDVAIGIGIAAVVLGIVAIVKFSGGSAAAAQTGAIVVTVMDDQPAEVWVNGQKKGVVDRGSFKLEKVDVGSYAVKVVRPGAKACEQKIDVAASGLGMVRCEFPVAQAAAPAPVTPTPAVAPTPAPTPPVAPTPAPTPAPAPTNVAAGSGAGSASGSGSATPAAVTPKTEPAKTEPPKTEPPKTAAPKTEPAKTEPPKTEPPKTEAKVDAPKPVAKTDEHHHHDHDAAPKTEVKTAPPKTEPPKTEPPKTTVATAPATDEGYLVAYTTPFARVVVDGTDTGKATPVGPRAKIHLKPGKHKVKFVVGDQSESFPITIEAGKTTTLTKDLQIGQ